MLEKILAPLDGSTLADAVLPHLIALTRINGTTLTLLHVLEASQSGETNVDPVRWDLRKIEAQAYLDETAHRLQGYDLTTRQVVLEGRAADRIVEFAQKEDFDLIALTSHGQGGLSSWNLSSVAYKVIHRLGKSTMILPAYGNPVPRGPRGELEAMHYRRIMVPLDGSLRAECALPMAEALARHHEAELILAHVVTRPDLIQRMPLSEEDNRLQAQIVERNRTEAIRYFEQLSARRSPTPHTRILDSNDVERCLFRLTQDESIDLVMLTAHGHSGHTDRPYGRLVSSFIDYGSVPLYIHQDLRADEIEPLHAERMLQNLETAIDPRLKAHEFNEYSVN